MTNAHYKKLHLLIEKNHKNTDLLKRLVNLGRKLEDRKKNLEIIAKEIDDRYTAEIGEQ